MDYGLNGSNYESVMANEKRQCARGIFFFFWYSYNTYGKIMHIYCTNTGNGVQYVKGAHLSPNSIDINVNNVNKTLCAFYTTILTY